MKVISSCHYCGAPSGSGRYCCDACEILDAQIHAQNQAQGLALPLPAESTATRSENSYSYLDNPDVRELYRHAKTLNYLFFAEGIHCSSCVHLLEKLPQYCEGVLQAQVNFAQSTVAIQLDEKASLAAVAQAIQELGYKPTMLTSADDVQEKYLRENRWALMRLAVAGFCAGNTMLFVIPIYSGLAGELAQTFNWISFGLFIPVLLFCAQPFWVGAWNSLKYQVINVDLPIAMALMAGFVLSTFNLIHGDGAIYFDSTASFVFLILSARYLLKRVQQNYLGTSRAMSFFSGETFIRVDETKARHSLPWSKISGGDHILVTRGQHLPADGVLQSPSATLDMSLFNGESLPKTFSRGMTLPAGTQVLDAEVEIQTLGAFQDSKLGNMLRQLDQEAAAKSHFVTLTDRLSQKLIITVFVIAVVFFVLYAMKDFSQALNRSLALITLACPCALAFGSPLTLGLAVKRAQKMGILLKSSDTFEKILKIKNVFFDKTGTLTEGSLSLIDSAPQVIEDDLRKIILSLEAKSYHPIAFALRRVWFFESLYSVEDCEEILGQGLRGKIAGHQYEIRPLSETTHDSELAVEIFKDGISQCRLYFTDSLRTDSAQIVQELKNRNLNTFILSGDKKSRVAAIADSCGVAKDQSFGELFPEDKRDILCQYENTCMIGDGANDSLALKKADVGIAVKGSLDLSLQSADVYFTRGGLAPLLDLLQLGQHTRRVLVRNLTISLIYNFVGGVLALMGFINPMMAAILMPLSSFLIVLSSIGGLR